MTTIINEGSEELRVGQMLGRYELLVPIAKGGMGSVWAARLKGTRGFRKLVAIKTILRTLENAQFEQMLFQEAMLASQIHHPNVAETFELGEHEGTLYLVMELVVGESLRFILGEAQSHGGVPLVVAINLVGQVCRGLAAAHDLRDEDGQRVGLIHRDISPPNILVADTGTVKIVDFGVATTTSSATYGSGEIKGKISYLAPEQLRGHPLDARVDVFSTGILLYLLTVGRHPFRCGSEPATIARILSDAPAASPSACVEDYPDALEQVVMRALSKERGARYSSITDLLEALENAYPSAFGPRADAMVASFVRTATSGRLQERRFSLRVAEEWAETSSSRHSVTSLPGVAASSAPSVKSSRAALFGASGVLTGLAIAAAVATVHFRVPPGTTRAAADQAPAAPSLTSRAAIVADPALQQRENLSPRVEAFDAGRPELLAEPAQLTRLRPTERAKPSPSERDERERRDSLDAAETSAVSEATASPTTDVSPVLSAPEVAPAPPPVIAPAPSPLPVSVRVPLAPVEPKLLASKVGHQRLLTNPRSKPVRVPSALKQSGQTFSATVNICAGSMGEVTKVSILSSAGPALDPQIVYLLSRWKYRPLVERGRATPFCYSMKYEVEPQ